MSDDPKLFSSPDTPSSFADADMAAVMRYWKGELSPLQHIRVSRWLDARPERRVWYRQFTDGLRESSWRGLSAEEVHGRQRAIMAAISASSDVTLRKVHATSRGKAHTPFSRWQRWSMLAATVTAAVGVMIVAGMHWESSRRTPEIFKTYATTTGQQATVRLPDGSVVTLAPQSRLRIPSRFGTASRTVLLQGEGRFSVVQQKDLPFTVHTSRAEATVLGTEFVLHEYLGEAEAQIAVLSGKVGVNPSGTRRMALLTPGMAGVVSDSSIVTRHDPDVQHRAEWANGYLVFRGVPAKDVVRTLSRWYGDRFIFSDSALANETVTAWISTRSRTEALKTLKLVLSVTYTQEDSIIMLHPDRAARAGRDEKLKFNPPQRGQYSQEVGR